MRSGAGSSRGRSRGRTGNGRTRGALPFLIRPGSGERPSRQSVWNAVVPRGRKESAKDDRPVRDALLHHPRDVLFPRGNSRRTQVRPKTIDGEIPIA